MKIRRGWIKPIATPPGAESDKTAPDTTDKTRDMVSHPSHYTSQVPGIECIDVVQHFNFNRGNAIKYVWRAGYKGDSFQDLVDLRKAREYLAYEIQRLGGEL